MDDPRETRFINDVELLGLREEVRELKRHQAVLRKDLTEAVDLCNAMAASLRPLLERYDALRNRT